MNLVNRKHAEPCRAARTWILIAVATGSLLNIRLAADDTPPARAKRPPVVVTEEARKLHRECLVFDGHNDLPWSMRIKAGSSFQTADISVEQDRFHTDIPRLRAGGVGAVFWSVYIPADTEKGRLVSHQLHFRSFIGSSYGSVRLATRKTRPPGFSTSHESSMN